jgi:thiol-disulfide isomerase/thioredoxin
LPSLTFKDAAGKEISTQSLKGKPVLINLWATWCGPCIAELPALNKLVSGGKIRVLTVSQDSEAAKDKVAAFLKARAAMRSNPGSTPKAPPRPSGR